MHDREIEVLGKPQEAVQESDSEHDTSELESSSDSLSISELGEDFLSNQSNQNNNRLSCKNVLEHHSTAAKKPSQMKLSMFDVANAPIEDSDMKNGSSQLQNRPSLARNSVQSISNAVGALKDAVRFKNAK